MLRADQVEQLMCMVSAMGRETLSRQFADHRGTFPLDFTSVFLETQPLDRLRHIFVALCLQQQHLPEWADEMATPTAA